MSALVISTPAVSLNRLVLAYWLPSAIVIGASYLVGTPLFVVFSALAVVALLMVSFFEALRGSYQITIDRGNQSVIAVERSPLRGARRQRVYELSSFEAVSTTWDENYWSYCVELVHKDGRSRLLVRRFAGQRLTAVATDTSAGLRAQLAAFAGLRDAGLTAAGLPESFERRTRSA
jgi:hypothetical protein